LPQLDLFRRVACLGGAILVAGCVSVSAHVVPGAFTPQSDGNSCYRKCQQVENSFQARCLDSCPGTHRVKGKACADLVVNERDACYQERDTSALPMVILLGVLVLGVLTFGVLALHNGALAH
jgi:hypothetical protein